MSDSWRYEIARMRNRWLITVTVIVSVLLHVGLFVISWKTNLFYRPAETPNPIYVNMVQAPGSIQDELSQGRIVDKKLPANDKRPSRADIISYRDNRTDRETHRKDVPFNEIAKSAGPKGTGRSASRQGTKGMDDRSGRQHSGREKTGPGVGRVKSTRDLINSVGYRDLPSKGSGNLGSGEGNLSPYNPKVGSPGDAININTKSFKYMSYFSTIKEKIEWAWVYPQGAQQSGQQGMLTLTFTILRNGRLGDVKLVRSSGYRLLDQAAMQAVRDAADFPPMPAKWDDQELTILANFQYRLIGAKYVY